MSAAVISLVDGPQPRSTPEVRRLTALLRARAHWLRGHQSLPMQRLTSLLPALFHASFPWPNLKGEPPGVEGVRALDCWARRAREVNLPAPSAIQRGRRAVRALLATVVGDGLEVQVIPAARASAWELQRVKERARAIETLMLGRGCAVRVNVLPGSGRPDDAGAHVRLLRFGALLAGHLPAGFFDEQLTPEPVAAESWATAPSDLARAFSLLCQRPWPTGEVAMLREATELASSAGCSVWALADPELLLAVLAAMHSRRPGQALRACALASTNPHTADAAGALARKLEGQLPPASSEIAALLSVGRALAVEMMRASRQVPGAREAAQQAAGPGFPVALVPALARLLSRARARGSLQLQPTLAGGFEVHDDQGATMGGGHSPAQAWVRALAVAQQLPARVQPGGADGVWRKLAESLRVPPAVRTLVLAIEAREIDGPPYDVLNRGPRRELAFGQVVAVLLRPGRRPSARTLGAHQAVTLALTEAARGSAVKFASADRTAQSVEARLTRLLARYRPGSPLAVEVEGRVLRPGHSLNGQPQAVFARRPIHSAVDTEAPDLGFEVTQGREVRVGPGQVHCLAWPIDQTQAQLMYVDEKSVVLRERVPLDDLEAHLQEARELLRHQSVALSVRVGAEVVRASLQTQRALAPAVELTVSGSLPFGLTLGLGDERFGAGCRWGWSAAASAALSRWPRTVLGRVRVTAVDVGVGTSMARPIEVLYARSVVQRRLWAHIVRLNRT